jgi:hypothetical protein
MADATERESHYTAHIEVKKVRHAVPGDERSRTAGRDREVHEITDIVVRSSDLHTLKEKLSAHIALIEED